MILYFKVKIRGTGELIIITSDLDFFVCSYFFRIWSRNWTKGNLLH